MRVADAIEQAPPGSVVVRGKGEAQPAIDRPDTVAQMLRSDPKAARIAAHTPFIPG